MTPTQKFLNQKSDVRTLTDKLDIDEVDVMTAAREQAGLYLKASRYRVQKMRARVAADSYLDSVRTEAALRIRQKDAAKKSKKPMTETNIKEWLLQDDEVVEAMSALNKAMEEEEIAKRLLDAYDHRGKSIRVIADLIGAELAIEKKMGEFKDLANLKGKISAKYPGSKDDTEYPD